MWMDIRCPSNVDKVTFLAPPLYVAVVYYNAI